jgi:hypothetical protein
MTAEVPERTSGWRRRGRWEAVRSTTRCGIPGRRATGIRLGSPRSPACSPPSPSGPGTAGRSSRWLYSLTFNLDSTYIALFVCISECRTQDGRFRHSRLFFLLAGVLPPLVDGPGAGPGPRIATPSARTC